MNYVDVMGDSINFFVYEGQKAKQVSFSQLDANIQKALVMFAQTKVGYNFLSQFATKGETFGSKEVGGVVSFSENGKNSEHNYNLMQFATEGAYPGYGGPRNIRQGKPIEFDVQLNVWRKHDKFPENYSVTIAHENFVHLNEHIENLVDFYNQKEIKDTNSYRSNVILNPKNIKREHNNYWKGIGNGYNLMRIMGIQNPRLKNIINKNRGK